MRTIAFHSHKGGVGKPTVSFALAKHAASEGLRTCLMDCDFLGSGIADLFGYRRRPQKRLDDLLFSDSPHLFPLDDLLGEYVDTDLRLPFEVIHSASIPDAEGEWAKHRQRLDRMLGTAGSYGTAQDVLRSLLGRLEERGFEVVVLDCHPGLGLISRSIRELVSLSVVVTTPHRGDVVGLFDQVNLDKGFDEARAFLLLNRTERADFDLAALRNALQADGVRGAAMRVALGHVDHFGADPERYASVPECEALRAILNVGPRVWFPKVDPALPHFAFCPRVLATA